MVTFSSGASSEAIYQEFNGSYKHTVYAVHSVVILIWQFGRFSSNHQIKITANSVVISQVLINSNNEQAYLPN